MEWLVVLGFEALVVLPMGAAAVALFNRAHRKQAREREQLLRETARRLGLTLVPGTHRGLFHYEPPMVTGTLEGMSVRVEESAGENKAGLRVTVATPPGSGRRIPPGLKVGGDAAVGRLVRGADLVVGDPAFDAAVRVEGEPAEVLGVLGPEARAEALALLGREGGAAVLAVAPVGGGMRVEGERLVVEVRPPVKPARIEAALAKGARFAARLALPAGDGGRVGARLEALARRATEDPVAGVRLRALEVLGALPGGGDMTRSVARRLLEDSHPGVRLRAAATLGGDAGFEALASIVRSPAPAPRASGIPSWQVALEAGWPRDLAGALDTSIEGYERLRGRALDRLLAGFPAERLLPLLREAIDGGSPPLRAAALRGMARSGDSSWEATAHRLLHDEAAEVRAVAVEVLGAAGTVGAVPHLRALAGRSGALDLALRLEIEKAVAAIQSRLGGAAAGQVSLPGGSGGEWPAGRVSLSGSPNDAQGRVTLAPGEEGG